MAKRRRKRRTGIARHPGVGVLSPGGNHKYYRLKYVGGDGQIVRKSTGMTSESVARQMAVELSMRLDTVIRDDLDITWPCFLVRYETEALAGKAAKTLGHWRTASNWYTNLMNPQYLSEVTTSSVSRFTAKLRTALEAKNGKSPDSTVASYLKQLRAAFHEAHRLGLLEHKVRIRMPRGADVMRSRSITLEEFERILMAVPKERPQDAAQWDRLLRGYWESGFRLRELVGLSWDGTGDVTIDTTRRYPLVRLGVQGHKSREQQYQPITPAFWDVCCETADEDRTGPVFPIMGRHGPVKSDWVGRIISRIGKKAGVITGLEDSAKCATSHDIGKRALTVRLADRLSEMDTAKWQRHKDPKTTRLHYYYREAEDLAAQLWDEEP